MRSRRIIRLTKPLVQPKNKRPARRTGEIECDEVLFGRLRELRKRLADERGVPAYVIFGDATLRDMARRYPATKDAMRGVFGVGERKFEEFGAVFAAVVAGHLETYPRVEFAVRD
jgi:ATP-dependent DNA helicase RecQ